MFYCFCLAVHLLLDLSGIFYWCGINVIVLKSVQKTKNECGNPVFTSAIASILCIYMSPLLVRLVGNQQAHTVKSTYKNLKFKNLFSLKFPIGSYFTKMKADENTEKNFRLGSSQFLSFI